MRTTPLISLPTLAILASLIVFQSPSQAADETPAAPAGGSNRRFYAITIKDNVIGYNMVEQAMEKVGGRQLLRIESETSMKFAVLGKERNTLARSKAWIDPATRRGVKYESTEKTNDLVMHHEAVVVDDKIRVWKYRGGKEKGKAVEHAAPDHFMFVGNNNFALWEAILAVASEQVGEKDTTSVKVFLPEAATSTEFVLQRGKPRKLTVAGAERDCRMWRLQGPGVEVAYEQATGRLIRMRVPNDEAIIQLADESIVKEAQKAQAEDILVNLFVKSNVVFDDFAKVTKMTAAVEVRVVGVENNSDVLQTAMQQFEGSKDDDQVVRGVMRIQMAPYRGADSPAFPTQDLNAALTEYTKAAPLIESDNAAIKKLSAQLTADASNRWDAVGRVAKWVHKEIAYTIADTPSAELCLETRKGDCGPHSTLTIALLRAAGIPARLVGGVMFTPSFGGSFGQHAWVEVHMGERGWVAIDPTTDELEQISATHIKLFEGLGGVKPVSIEVRSFDPPNKSADAIQFAEAKPFPWALNTPYVFKYRQGDSEIGKETITIEEVEAEGRQQLKLQCDIRLKINLLASLSGKTTLICERNGRPVQLKRTLSALLQTTKINSVFEKDKVKTTVSGLTRLEREIDLPPGAFSFDNNLMGCWLPLSPQLPLKDNKSFIVRTFHSSSLQLIPLTITPKPLAKIMIGDKEVECYECEVAPIKNTFWITKDGRFVRAKQGNLVIELEELSPKKSSEIEP